MKSFALILAAALVSTSASAVTIDGLYNSGVVSGGINSGAGGGATTGNGVDPHWTLVGGTAYNGGTNNVFPIGPWLSENNTSRWLTFSPTASDGAPASTTFRLTFDLTGFNAATASFSGQASSDDSGQLFLNGSSIGSVGSFTSFTNFAATSGFISGVNTLDFVVANGGGGPSGARIEFSASDVTAAGAVPEPASWAMVVGGFGFAGLAVRRRRAQVRVSYS